MTKAPRMDRVTRIAPFGVRFWDPVEVSPVTEGLIVTLRAVNSRACGRAIAYGSGIFSARDVRGLWALEQGAGDETYWASVTPQDFVVEVRDSLGQFMPFSFPAQLPTRGLFVWTCAQSPPALARYADGVVLFSTPARVVAPMRAVIRAQIQDAQTARPAAGAVLAASVGNAPAVCGIADRQGRVAIVLHYPEPSAFPIVGDWSPPPYAPVGDPLSSYTWPVTLAAQYAPPVTWSDCPDLCTTLSQPAAQLWGDTLGNPLGSQTLTMGMELVVRSTDATSGQSLPVLLVASG